MKRLENFTKEAKSWGLKESDMTERLHFHFSLSCTGEGNGNPLQYSCLENPRDGGAWWAALYGVAQSQTRLKRLSSSSSRYLKQEDGEGLLRKASPEQQNLWKAFVKLQRRRDKEGMRWINWEQHEAIGAAITQDIAASSYPNVSL